MKHTVESIQTKRHNPISTHCTAANEIEGETEKDLEDRFSWSSERLSGNLHHHFLPCSIHPHPHHRKEEDTGFASNHPVTGSQPLDKNETWEKRKKESGFWVAMNHWIRPTLKPVLPFAKGSNLLYQLSQLEFCIIHNMTLHDTGRKRHSFLWFRSKMHPPQSHSLDDRIMVALYLGIREVWDSMSPPPRTSWLIPEEQVDSSAAPGAQNRRKALNKGSWTCRQESE